MGESPSTSTIDQALLVEILANLTEGEPPTSPDLVHFFVDRLDVLRQHQVRLAARLATLKANVSNAQSCLAHMKGSMHRALSEATRQVSAQCANNGRVSDELTDKINHLEQEYRRRSFVSDELDYELEAARCEEQKLLETNAELFAAFRAAGLPRIEGDVCDPEELRKMIDGHHAFLNFYGSAAQRAGATHSPDETDDDNVIPL